DIPAAVDPDNHWKTTGIRLVSLTELRRENVEIETVFGDAGRTGKYSKGRNLGANIAEVRCVEGLLPLGNRLRGHPAQLAHWTCGVRNPQELIYAVLEQTVDGTLGGLYEYGGLGREQRCAQQ